MYGVDGGITHLLPECGSVWCGWWDGRPQMISSASKELTEVCVIES